MEKKTKRFKNTKRFFIIIISIMLHLIVFLTIVKIFDKDFLKNDNKISLGSENGNLAEASNAVKIGFTTYMNRIADAGTTVIPTTASHDDLKLELDIYYDPTILNNQGKRLDGANDTPVIDAINNYLTGIEFNGKFISTKQTDVLQKVEGIVLPVIKKAWSKYGSHNYTDTDIQRVGLINEIRIADAGYMRLDEEATIINYIAYTDD